MHAIFTCTQKVMNICRLGHEEVDPGVDGGEGGGQRDAQRAKVRKRGDEDCGREDWRRGGGGCFPPGACGMWLGGVGH